MPNLNSFLSYAVKLCVITTSVAALSSWFTLSTTRAVTLEDLVNEFQQFSNDKTPFGVTDGNPQSATAFLASDAYARFGLRPTLSTAPIDAGHFQVGISGGGGAISTKSVDEYYFATDLYLGFRFNDKIGLGISLPLEYRDTHNIETYIGGVNVGLPITLIDAHGAGNSWVVTPWMLGASAGGSKGLAQGGYIFGGGVTSSFSHHIDKLTLTLANQIGYDFGYPLAYSSEFSFEQNISQFILKNGVQATYDFTDAFFADAGITYTNFLKGAYTDNYFTVFAGVGFRFGPASGLRIGYTGDIDHVNDYYTYGGNVELYFAF